MHRAATLSNQPMPRQHNDVVGDKRDGIDTAQIDSCGVRPAERANRNRQPRSVLYAGLDFGFRLESRAGFKNDRSAAASLRTIGVLPMMLALLCRIAAAAGDARAAT